MTDKELITILNSIQKTIGGLIYNSNNWDKEVDISFNETEKLIVEQIVNNQTKISE